MRLILTALLFSALALAEVHERKVAIDGERYVVRYLVCEQCLKTIPSMGCKGILFVANVEVWKLGRQYNFQVGHDFQGYWTEHGCNEDDPAMLVHKALSLKKDPKPDPIITKGDGASALNDHINDSGHPNIQFNGYTASIMTWDECAPGQVSLNPEADGDTVVIHARVCKDGKWVAAKVRVQ